MTTQKLLNRAFTLIEEASAGVSVPENEAKTKAAVALLESVSSTLDDSDPRRDLLRKQCRDLLDNLELDRKKAADVLERVRRLDSTSVAARVSALKGPERELMASDDFARRLADVLGNNGALTNTEIRSAVVTAYDDEKTEVDAAWSVDLADSISDPELRSLVVSAFESSEDARDEVDRDEVDALIARVAQELRLE